MLPLTRELHPLFRDYEQPWARTDHMVKRKEYRTRRLSQQVPPPHLAHLNHPRSRRGSKNSRAHTPQPALQPPSPPAPFKHKRLSLLGVLHGMTLAHEIAAKLLAEKKRKEKAQEEAAALEESLHKVSGGLSYPPVDSLGYDRDILQLKDDMCARVNALLQPFGYELNRSTGQAVSLSPSSASPTSHSPLPPKTLPPLTHRPSPANSPTPAAVAAPPSPSLHDPETCKLKNKPPSATEVDEKAETEGADVHRLTPQPPPLPNPFSLNPPRYNNRIPFSLSCMANSPSATYKLAPMAHKPQSPFPFTPHTITRRLPNEHWTESVTSSVTLPLKSPKTSTDPLKLSNDKQLPPLPMEKLGTPRALSPKAPPPRDSLAPDHKPFHRLRPLSP